MSPADKKMNTFSSPHNFCQGAKNSKGHHWRPRVYRGGIVTISGHVYIFRAEGVFNIENVSTQLLVD